MALFSLPGGLVSLGPEFGRTFISVPPRLVHLCLDLCLILLGRSLHGAIRLFDLLLELREVVRYRHPYSSFRYVPLTLRLHTGAVNPIWVGSPLLRRRATHLPG